MPNPILVYAVAPNGEMIVCREDKSKARIVAQLFKKIFPELSRRDIKKAKITRDPKLCPDGFSNQMGAFLMAHDWNNEPIIAVEKRKEKYTVKAVL